LDQGSSNVNVVLGTALVARIDRLWRRISKNDDWQLADRAAAFLGVDRDVCRGAFHRELAYRVRAVVQRVLTERHLPGYVAEEAIEEWARERSARVYGETAQR
jgi:hypothetical protein